MKRWILFLFLPYLAFAETEASISLPVYVFDIEQVKSEITSQLAEGIQGTPKNKPILLLIGGYPGAGKTTLIHALTKSHDITVISFNAIRQALVDRQLKNLGYDWDLITGVNHHLFKMCLQRKLNIVIDANAHNRNIKLFEEMLETEHFKEFYQVIKICLNPPTEVLLSRVRAREQKEGVHQGTEEDVLQDVSSAHKKMNMDDYALIIKNDEHVSFKTELEIVESFLKSFFDQQLDYTIYQK